MNSMIDNINYEDLFSNTELVSKLKTKGELNLEERKDSGRVIKKADFISNDGKTSFYYYSESNFLKSNFKEDLDNQILTKELEYKNVIKVLADAVKNEKFVKAEELRKYRDQLSKDLTELRHQRMSSNQ